MSRTLSSRSPIARSASRLAKRLTRFERRCKRDRGGMATLCAVLIPVLVGLGTLAIDQGYYGYRSLLLKQTTQNAALAAAQQIYTYYTTGKPTTVQSTATTYGGYNMPSAQYGSVVLKSNVTLGTWSNGAFTAGGTNPTAVQVTGLNTTANSNPVPLFLGSFFGRPTADITYTVVASYGSGKAFNTIVVNDMSQSFSDELADQVTADQQILNCVNGVVGANSYFGVTLSNGHAYTYIPLTAAQANYTALNLKLALLLTCATSGASCGTGSNIASGMYSAIQQFNNAAYTGTSKNIVVITDGVPNPSTTYTSADGLTCTNSSKDPCTTADMEAGAQAQAAAAKAAGINISTIYYSGESNTTPADAAASEAFLATLVTGTGTALVAPSTAAIDAAYASLCSSIPSVLEVGELTPAGHPVRATPGLVRPEFGAARHRSDARPLTPRATGYSVRRPDAAVPRSGSGRSPASPGVSSDRTPAPTDPSDAADPLPIISCTRPGRGRITTIRSARNTASSTSCVTIRMVGRNSCHRSSTSVCCVARVNGSSAENGSSSSRMPGWPIRARAMATRCC